MYDTARNIFRSPGEDQNFALLDGYLQEEMMMPDANLWHEAVRKNEWYAVEGAQ